MSNSNFAPLFRFWNLPRAINSDRPQSLNLMAVPPALITALKTSQDYIEYLLSIVYSMHIETFSGHF